MTSNARNRERDRRRQAEQPERAWYRIKRWSDLRQRVYVRDGGRCRMCGRVVAQFHADHIKPHGFDPVLFWDEANVQVLCEPCHNSDKQRVERGGKVRQVVGVDGWPI